MNLNDIIQAAQGGQGVNNLASQFGLSPEQAQAAIQAMIPAFSGGLQNAAQSPSGLGGLLSQLTDLAAMYSGRFSVRRRFPRRSASMRRKCQASALRLSRR